MKYFQFCLIWQQINIKTYLGLQTKEKNRFASAKDNKSIDYSFKEKNSDFNIKGLYNFNYMCENVNLKACEASIILYFSSSVN